MKYRLMRFPGGKARAVTLSYDDASKHDIDLVRIIDKYAMKCTFNVCSGFMQTGDKEYFLSAEEIWKHIIPGGHEIAVHGEYHKALGRQTVLDGMRDILNCRLALEDTFGRIIRGSAYADSGIMKMHGGADYADIKRYLTDLGIVYARSVGGDNDRFDIPEDWHNWLPTAHHACPDIYSFIDKFRADCCDDFPYDRRRSRLFYLWGHSFEFEKTGTWDSFDRICSLLGGKDDTWYATNIEIYDYVNAYNSLVFSADSTKIYNPSATAVWMEADRKTYCIEPGMTVTVPKK